MHIQACSGCSLVSFLNWLLKLAPCNSFPHSSLLCPAAVLFLRAAVPIPSSGHIFSAKPSQHPSGPWCWCTGPPASPPNRSHQYFSGRARLHSTGLGLALSGCEIPLKPRGFFCREESMQKGCQDCNLTYYS